MSKDNTTTSTNQSTASVAPDATTAARASQLWNLGLDAQRGGPMSYNGTLTAGLSPDQLRAFSLIGNSVGTGQPALNTGVDYAKQAGAFTPGAITPGTASVSTVGSIPQVGTSDISAPASVASGLPGITAGPSAGARDVTASTFPQYDISKYLNPFTSNVVDASLSDIERSRREAQNQIGGRQAASGAFGDARSGVEASLTNRDYTKQAADTAASLRAQGYTDAANRIEADAQRKLAADQGNQGADVSTGIANLTAGTNANIANGNLGLSARTTDAGNSLAAAIARANNTLSAGTTNATLGAGVGEFNAGAENTGSQFNVNTGLTSMIQNGNNALAANGQRLGAATTLGNLGMAQQQNVLNSANALGAAGGVEQGTTQAGLTAQYADWLRKAGWNDQQIQQLSGIFSALPKGSTTTSSSTGTQTTPQSLIPSILGAAGTLIPGGSAVGGVINSLAGK